MSRLAIAALAAAALVAAATPANAAPRTLSASARAVPVQVPNPERKAWREVFADLRAGRTDEALAAARGLPDSPLRSHVEAEALLRRDLGTVALADPAAWLATNRDLPQASAVAARLQAQGVESLVEVPQPRSLQVVSYSKRGAQPSRRDSRLESAVRGLVSADRPEDAEAAFDRVADGASPDSRAEWAQKIAWSYYRLGEDRGALRMGMRAAEGPGEYGALGGWVAGLAAWRMDDCENAAAGFDKIALKDSSDGLAAAGAYWSSRAHLACGRPELVSARLRAASVATTSFYGMLARRTLGIDSPLDWSEPDFINADWNYLGNVPGARRAVALVELGELGLADRQLRHLAAISDPQRYQAIMRLAARLSLPATQLWLSSRSPNGQPAPLSSRFPAPDWQPARGWRVDQALVYAHALQESRFVTDAVSHAGARGIMQLMPGTAAKISRDLGEEPSRELLKDPAFNIEFGQTYLEELRDMSYTSGLLPKVIAAYNAGPGSVQKWNASVRDNGDPLLFIESIPFKETRAYVEIVLRNYWMYELRDGRKPSSMEALAQGLWPKFPGMPGPTAVRVERSGVVMAATP